MEWTQGYGGPSWADPTHSERGQSAKSGGTASTAVPSVPVSRSARGEALGLDDGLEWDEPDSDEDEAAQREMEACEVPVSQPPARPLAKPVSDSKAFMEPYQLETLLGLGKASRPRVGTPRRRTAGIRKLPPVPLPKEPVAAAPAQKRSKTPRDKSQPVSSRVAAAQEKAMAAMAQQSSARRPSRGTERGQPTQGQTTNRAMRNMMAKSVYGTPGSVARQSSRSRMEKTAVPSVAVGFSSKMAAMDSEDLKSARARSAMLAGV